jgi:hypothetical protein
VKKNIIFTSFKNLMHMKALIKIMIIAAFLLISMPTLQAQAPPHPNGGAAPTSGNTPVGAGAPIGSGTLLLIGLAGLYGGKKVFTSREILDQ